MFLIAQQWEGAGDARPGDKGKQGPWGPAHLGSVISALIGVNSTRPLPFATPNVGKCAMATLCSERGVPCRISALLQPKQRLTLLQLGPCRDCQMPFGDFRDLEKGRRTQCLAFLLLSTLCHPQATVDQCCVPAAGKSMALPISSTEPRASLPLTLSTRALAHSWPWPLGPSWREVPCARSSTGCEDLMPILTVKV